MSFSKEDWLPTGALAGVGEGYREEFRAYEELGYEYNEFGVFTDAEGRVFVSYTTGCSCSSPWKDTDPGDLTLVHDYAELRRKLNEWNGTRDGAATVLTATQLTEAHGRLMDLRLF